MNEENLEKTNDTQDETSKDETLPNSDVEKKTEEETTKEPVQKKLVNKILIGVIGFLLFLIIIGIILYFIGFFDPEVKEEVKNETPIKIEEQSKKEEYSFDLKEINTKKLNEQLALLTNQNINQEKLEEEEKIRNEKKILEEQKKKEEERLKLEEERLKQEKEDLEAKKIELENQKIELENLKNIAIAIKEELENNKKVLEENSINPISNNQNTNSLKVEDNNLVIDEKDMNEKQMNSFLKFILVAKIKGNLQKSYLDKITSINLDAKLCRDDKNRIEIYFGPFDNEEKRVEIFEKLQKNKFSQSFLVELTNEEYNKRCNY